MTTANIDTNKTEQLAKGEKENKKEPLDPRLEGFVEELREMANQTSQSHIHRQTSVGQSYISALISGTAPIDKLSLRKFCQLFPFAKISIRGNTTNASTNTSKGDLNSFGGDNIGSMTHIVNEDSENILSDVIDILKEDSFSDAEKVKFSLHKLEKKQKR